MYVLTIPVLLDSSDEGATIVRNVDIYQSMLCNLPEDLNTYQYRSANLKSRFSPIILSQTPSACHSE